MVKKKRTTKTTKTAANFDDEAQLWKMADALHGSTEAAEYMQTGQLTRPTSFAFETADTIEGSARQFSGNKHRIRGHVHIMTRCEQ